MAKEEPAQDKEPIKLQELVLPDEGGDRAFKSPSGRRWRAKVQIAHMVLSKPPITNGAASAIPNTISVRLSLAELDESKKVMESGGQLAIFDAHEILFTADDLADPELDIEGAIDRALAREIEKAEAITAKRAELLSHLEKRWGTTIPQPTQPGVEPILGAVAMLETGELETQALPDRVGLETPQVDISDLAGRKGEGEPHDGSAG